jgi:hypothetical protein
MDDMEGRSSPGTERKEAIGNKQQILARIEQLLLQSGLYIYCSACTKNKLYSTLFVNYTI